MGDKGDIGERLTRDKDRDMWTEIRGLRNMDRDIFTGNSDLRSMDRSHLDGSRDVRNIEWEIWTGNSDIRNMNRKQPSFTEKVLEKFTEATHNTHTSEEHKDCKKIIVCFICFGDM